MKTIDTEDFQINIGYRFGNIVFLENALRHSSFTNENSMSYEENNERLEYLGDAVLELASSRFIFEEYPKMPEGKMTTLRASLVCEPTLAEAARQIHLDQAVLLGIGEEKTGGRSRDSILSDAFEAVIGAIYLDGGFDEADRFIRKWVLSDIENKQLYYDAKSHLQEIVQEKYHENTSIVYHVINETGPAHNKEFTVSCEVQGTVMSEGVGGTKKKAEQKAAYEALLSFKNR